MALRGNLKDFSLPDVFQLVTFSKKTGVLRISCEGGSEGSVWFRGGDVFFAQSNWHGEPLGERLVHASKITPSALQKALKARKSEGDEGRRLGQILVDEGFITDKVLEAFVQEQIQDTIFDLMRWDEGDFDFEVLPDVVDEDIGLSVSIENIVMEGSRRLEEWTRIKKKIPSMDIVFKMATAPGEGTFEISLKPIEWNLLLLVDGTRSVSELAFDTNRTDFEVARIMYGLFSAGLLEVATDEEVEKLREERAEREVLVADLRAKEKEAEEIASREAQERESALEAEAEARRTSHEDVEASPTPVEELEERREPEVPEFLAGGDEADASAEDMAVFEEMMGAVLQTPEEVAEATEETPPAEDAPEPEVEVAEESEVESGSEVEPVEEPEIEEVALESLEIEPDPEIPEAPIAVSEAEVIEETPEKTGDLEADLMALGLGELPTGDLLEPVAAGGEIPEPPVLEIEPVEETETLEDLLEAIEAPDEVAEEVVEDTIEITGAEQEADFQDILESLEEDTGDDEIIRTDTMPESEEVAPSGGVISTDAFLEDISGDDLGVGLSSGLGDELSALTGAESGRRPSASVNKLPDAGQMEIHRDQTVDKDLVMQIIEGIKKL